MSAARWLAHGDWATATLVGTAVDAEDLVLAGSGAARVRHGTAVVPAGLPDPAQVDSTTADRWRRVLVRLSAPLPAGCWLRVWTRTASSSAPPPSPPRDGDADDDRSAVPTPADRWRAAPVGAVDVRVLCRPEAALWLAVELGGDGAGTPRVADIRVETDDLGPVTQLPRVYRQLSREADEADDGDGLLGRYAGLLGSRLRETGSLLEELPALLNPAVAPDRADAPWLERLAAWVAVDPARLPTAPRDRRESVATAVERHGRRGTLSGLLDAIRRETGVPVEVVEPLRDAAVWRLDGAEATSALGLTTGLVPADPGPPVLDRTALLDASALVRPEEAGRPVHAHRAHRVCVHVPDGTPDQVRAVDAVVQRERPAHVLARTRATRPWTAVPSVVGRDHLPNSGPPGLADDVSYDVHVDGPGQRLGTVRLPATNPSLAATAKGHPR
ncbi:phage tail protein [Streptomyces sp. CA-135486]|uniref:phage tail protein n=1 Tax=Streptomyces sp. CA-135486 TaxID=3240049 RepID=UPI003D90F047